MIKCGQSGFRGEGLKRSVSGGGRGEMNGRKERTVAIEIALPMQAHTQGALIITDV